MTNLLESIIQEVLEQVPSYYLVELKLSSNNSKISIFVDADNGVDIDFLNGTRKRD
jgi:ribosome maturation factor RimP